MSRADLELMITGNAVHKPFFIALDDIHHGQVVRYGRVGNYPVIYPDEAKVNPSDYVTAFVGEAKRGEFCLILMWDGIEYAKQIYNTVESEMFNSIITKIKTGEL